MEKRFLATCQVVSLSHSAALRGTSVTTFLSLRLRLLLSVFLLITVLASSVNLEARKRGATSKSVAKGSKGSKKSGTSKSGAKSGKSSKSSKLSKRARKQQRARDIAAARQEARNPKALAVISISKDSIITDGIIYRQINVTHADSSHSLVHALTCVLRNPSYSVMTLKADNQANALERLRMFRQRLDSVENKTIYAATNAHFWRAGSTTPIGPTVCSGEVCEMQPYKDWTCCFFDTKNRPVIDSMQLSATIRKSRGAQFRVSSVNRRLVADSLVVFNSFIGQSVPFVPTTQIEQEIEESVSDSTALSRDSSEIRFTKDSLRAALTRLRQEASAEYTTTKVQCRYLRSPAVNQDIPMVVLETVDSGSVNMPLRGCVLSMGSAQLQAMRLKAGDTLILHYTTSKRDTTVYTNAVCGTPLLVSNGSVPDNLKGSSSSFRFLYHRLARTALGTDITRNTIYLCTVECNARSKGFTIPELAEFMKRFGAYSAMNLDGGGSAQMIVGDSVVSHTADQGQRRVSVALAFGKRKARVKTSPDAKKEN